MLVKRANIMHFKGYSLIEIIIVMVIIGILTTAAIPTLIDLYQRYHLSSNAQLLSYHLQFAKSEAIKNNQSVYFTFQTGDNWCYGARSGATCNCSIANSCTLLRESAQSSQDLSLSLSSISSLVFQGTNGATLNSGVVYFTIYGQSTSIGVKVSALGNTKLCSGTVSGYPSCS